jgi:hypothetical protein
MALFLSITNALQKRAGQSPEIKMAAAKHSRCEALGVITSTLYYTTAINVRRCILHI